VHSVIFGGFAANAIADRVNDSGCVAILTQIPATAGATKFSSSAPSMRPWPPATPSSM